MHTPLICSGCSKGHLIADIDTGETICDNCGLVHVTESQDRAASTASVAYPARSNAGVSNFALIYKDLEYSTLIDRANTDARGHKLDPSTLSRMQRLRTWDFRLRTDSNAARNIKQALNELDALKDKLGLPDSALEKASYIYRKAQVKGLVHGRSVSAILSTAVYIACREMGTPRTLKEISVIANLERKDIARDYRLLVSELDLQIPLLDPMKCIVGVANRINISEKTKRLALDSMNEIIRNEISAGKNPMGLAATVLYVSCLKNRENKTQADIARAAGITEVTIRNRYSDLKRTMI
ncbi:MAG TPA: transcription initiation factor IIB [Nitrososphaeraceae archaeon]|jgi:transcription initiation factor TFIIB